MRVVIDIPESVKQAFDNATEDDIYGCYYDYNSIIGRAIKNGVPLPKGHGRLKDVDALLKKHPEFDTYPFPSTTIDNAPTIIEAEQKAREDKA